jgi:CBS domain-containing protein
MQIRDVMTKEIRSAGPSDTIRDVARLMRDLNVGTIPVCDNDKLLGLITDRDIVVRCVAEDMDPDECTVTDHMSADIVTARPDMSTDEAMRLMSEHQIRRLPVMEGEKMIGIVSLGDLAVESKGVDGQEIKEGLKNISQPVHQTEGDMKKAA